MRVESTDASRFSDVKIGNPGNSTKDNNIKNEPKIEIRDMDNLTEFEKNALSVSDKVVINAIEKANKAISASYRRFEFSIHEKTKEIMVKVIDTQTDEVVREIPPEKILDMVAKMWEMAGIIVDERR